MKNKLHLSKIMLSALTVLMFACVLLIGNSTKSNAATRKCYTIKSGNTTVYSNTGLTAKYGTIFGTDEITVITVTGTYTKVTYPISGGRTKTGYIPTGAILTATTGNSYTSRAKITTYRRASTAITYGYIAAGDSVMVLGKSGSFTQVKYPVSNGFKYAFIPTSELNAYILPRTTNSVSVSGGSNSGSSSNSAQKIVAYELSQLGIGDSKGNNNVKYNTWYYGRQVSGSGYAWCMAFQSYCAKQLGVLNTAVPRTASCAVAVNWYKNRGKFQYARYYGGSYTPKAGDLVFYYSGGSFCHVGMITSAPVNGYLQTVEGNIQCADGNWKVVQFTKNSKRTINNSYVYGYGTPCY